jgi:subtilase family serine protease
MLALLLAPLLFGAPVMAASTSCTGADPGITKAAVQSTTTNGNLNHYVIAITVQNMGTANQPSNLLQSVNVYQNGDKVDQKGLQPLSPGKSQTVTYAFDRASEARAHTTHFRFMLTTPSGSNCSADNDSFRLDV